MMKLKNIASRLGVSLVASLILTAALLQLLSYANALNTNDGYLFFIIIAVISFVFSNPIWKWMQFKER